MLEKYDQGIMYTAVRPASANCGGAKNRAYIHRGSGEIAFISESYGVAESWYGKDVADEQVRQRAEIERNPSQWAEIPECDDDGEEDRFISEFLETLKAA